MIIKEMPITERPREKLLEYGAHALSNRELLAVMLGNGTGGKTALELADEILCMDDSGMSYLAEVGPVDLKGIKGLGDAKICTLIAARELGIRLAISRVREQAVIRGTEDVVDMCMEEMRHYKKEHFDALLLNTKGGIISKENISIGDLAGSLVHPREAFKTAVNRSAASIIFIHNHPSGDPSPSREDIDITKRLCRAGDIMGIKVHDHIIIGDGSHVSLRASGYI